MRTAKNKIYIALVIWLAAIAVAFFYAFKIFDAGNQVTINKILEQNKQLASLQAQRESFKQAQQDLNTMASESIQPADFFSQDVTLVKEIQVLEDLGNKLNVDFSLGGLSGTVKNAPKANSLSGLVSVPYSISLKGPFPRIVDFVETMENLDFVTTLTSLSMSSGDSGVNANLTAVFYLRPPH